MKRLLLSYFILVLLFTFRSTVSAATIGLDAVHAAGTPESLGEGWWYANMRMELEAAGYSLQMLHDFKPESLAACDSIFVAQARYIDNMFSAEEIVNIHAYVEGGKGLLTFAEGGYSTHATTNNLNDLLAPYGVAVNSVPTSGNGYLVNGFVSHPVTSGIESIGLDYQRRLISITAPAIDLTLGSEENDMLAVVDGINGSGNVVIMSDMAPFGFSSHGDTDIHQHDNLQLLMNVSGYVTVPEPSTVCMILVGALSLIWFRRRSR